MKKISLVVLFLWLYTFFSHTSHELRTSHQATSNQYSSIEHSETLYQHKPDIECHLCSNHIDAQYDIDLLGQYSPVAAFAANATFLPLSALSKYFLLPNLRGPPLHN